MNSSPLKYTKLYLESAKNMVQEITMTEQTIYWGKLPRRYQLECLKCIFPMSNKFRRNLYPEENSEKKMLSFYEETKINSKKVKTRPAIAIPELDQISHQGVIRCIELSIWNCYDNLNPRSIVVFLGSLSLTPPLYLDLLLMGLGIARTKRISLLFVHDSIQSSLVIDNFKIINFNKDIFHADKGDKKDKIDIGERKKEKMLKDVA